ncbi:methyl-accepting chemotaxis protein [Vibrio sp. ES.051]|uniref:methyl-accepting chemotaxis protein n=1 Tax=Vibrio sp. ES.051 TaxID=1761909 RepID=UPI000BF2911F|nr:methyl-accepting chemotaxis protein [Vibrio sp. ES.051]PFG56281.1 methyl-accepting chemotaxis protein [Vibrio sp. ES.051]
MSNWSIRNKLLLALACLMLVIIGGIFLSITLSLKEVTTKTTDFSAKMLEENTVETIAFATKSAEEEVEQYINSALNLAEAFSSTLEATSLKNDGYPLDRKQVEAITQELLVDHREFSALYTYFEPNAYDNLDNQFASRGLSHSTDSGSLEVYWYRDGSEVIQERITDSDEKYDGSLNEFGKRNAEWYLCSLETKNNCILEPYREEVSDGISQLMTSITYPVLDGNTFLGMVGIDIFLPELQKLVTQLSDGLFNNQGEMLIISEQGTIIADSALSNAAGQSLKAVNPKLWAQIKDVNNQREQSTQDSLISVSEITLTKSSKWTLVYLLPKSVALADSITYQKILTSSFNEINSTLAIQALIGLILALVVISVMLTSFTKPLVNMSKHFQTLASSDGDLTINIPSQKHKELDEMATGFNNFIDKFRAMIVIMKSQSRGIGTNSESLLQSSNASKQAAQSQSSETDSIATAMNEMAATAQEVSVLAQNTSQEANESDRLLNKSLTMFTKTLSDIHVVAKDMDTACERMSQVACRSEDISKILDVIRDIAEQTNLLALNAAIEAARAGDTGRGFAVVADEVRNLASRTQHSTEEIDALIHSLQTEVDSTVNQIEINRDKVSSAVKDVESSNQSLQDMTSIIGSITSNSMQVATAAEEQSSVTEEINRNITAIVDTGRQLNHLSEEVETISQEMESSISELDKQLNMLKS